MGPVIGILGFLVPLLLLAGAILWCGGRVLDLVLNRGISGCLLVLGLLLLVVLIVLVALSGVVGSPGAPVGHPGSGPR